MSNSTGEQSLFQTSTQDESCERTESHRVWLRPMRWPRSVWISLIVFAFVSMPFCSRWWFLSHVPNVAEPEDLQRLLARKVSDKDNAFTHYRAADMMRSKALIDWRGRDSTPLPPGYSELYSTVLRDGLSRLGEADESFLAAQRPSLDEWLRGTEISEFQPFTADQMSAMTLLPVHGTARQFIATARVEALRCIESGDMDDAWRWLRACVRFTGHLNQYSGLVQRNIGAAAHYRTSVGIVRWAEHPAVTVDQLQQALRDIRAEYALNPPFSESLKVEFLLSRQMFLSREWADSKKGMFYGRPAWEERLTAARGPAFWVVAEPELSLRVERQRLVNLLNEIDKPLWLRTSQSTKQEFLFDLDPNVPRKPGQLDPRLIEQGQKTSVLKNILGPRWIGVKPVDKEVWLERSRQAALETLLALQAYRRDHGTYPESLEALIPTYLESLPIDPCDPTGRPIRYRRDSTNSASVWNIGLDGQDDDGRELNIDEDDQYRSPTSNPDVGFEVKFAE